MRPSRVPHATLLLAAALAAPAAAQTADTTGGIRVTTDAVQVTLNGRIHAQLNTTDFPQVPSSEMTLRRVRLEANVAVRDWISARIQPEYAGSRVELRDAWLRLELDPALQLTAGKQQRPFGRIAPMSSNRILPAERGLRIRGVGGSDQYDLLVDLGYAERDVGLLISGRIPGAPARLSYAAGWFNGPGRAEAPSRETGQWVARLEARPASLARVGASWSRRDFVVNYGTPEVVRTDAGDAFVVDADLGRETGGPRLVGEVSWGDTEPAEGARFVGAQGWLSWRSGAVSERISAIEPLLRVSWADPYRGGRTSRVPVGGTLVTPGVNLWLGGLNRIAINYDWWNPDTGESRESLKVQLQVAF